MDAFVAISDSTRRGMLELLRSGERSAGDLVRSFPRASQPGISKHLRILRDCGLVDVRNDEQRRIYSLRAQGFAELDSWISRYRAFWPVQLEALSRHLDATAPQSPPAPSQDIHL
ncbi:MAG TPA: metalloregulator ArsR/SmtB family transcription factor [Opitutaceae bacterium]|jgi:DNA-binding transcriptional ArsR family regulator